MIVFLDKSVVYIYTLSYCRYVCSQDISLWSFTFLFNIDTERNNILPPLRLFINICLTKSIMYFNLELRDCALM